MEAGNAALSNCEKRLFGSVSAGGSGRVKGHLLWLRLLNIAAVVTRPDSRKLIAWLLLSRPSSRPFGQPSDAPLPVGSRWPLPRTLPLAAPIPNRR